MNRVNILMIKNMKNMKKIYREMKNIRKHFRKLEEHNRLIKSILWIKLWRKQCGLMRLNSISSRLWCLLSKIGRWWNILLFNKIHSLKFQLKTRKNEKFNNKLNYYKGDYILKNHRLMSYGMERIIIIYLFLFIKFR